MGYTQRAGRGCRDSELPGEGWRAYQCERSGDSAATQGQQYRLSRVLRSAARDCNRVRLGRMLLLVPPAGDGIKEETGRWDAVARHGLWCLPPKISLRQPRERFCQGRPWLLCDRLIAVVARAGRRLANRQWPGCRRARSSSQLPQKRAGVTMGQGLGVFFFFFFFPFFPFFGWASVQAAEIRYFAP